MSASVLAISQTPSTTVGVGTGDGEGAIVEVGVGAAVTATVDAVGAATDGAAKVHADIAIAPAVNAETASVRRLLVVPDRSAIRFLPQCANNQHHSFERR
jgi:hypothetical protein